MVFSSVPLYLDPYNWQQQQSHQQQQQLGGGGEHGSSSQNPQLPLSSPPAGVPVGSIRPGSMADRARLAKLPMPEPRVKCPRCESTNTKFCYFNNYNLSQPRYFCKTCRRYWTRGGALRNVPVGGGCRRNKRSSSKNNSASSSKPSTAINNNDTIIVPTGHLQDEAAPITSSSNNTGIGFPLLASLQGMNSQSNLGLNFSGGIIQPPQIGTTNYHNQSSILGFHVESSSSTSNYLNFLAGFEPPSSSSLYTFHNDDPHHHQNVEAPPLPSSSIFGGTHHHQLVIRSHEDQNQNAPLDIKAEEAMSQGFNFVSSSRPLMGGVSENNHHQFWDGNSNNAAWPDFSGINNSSSTRNNM